MDKKFVKRFKSCQNSLSALHKTGGESDRGFYIAGWGAIAAALLLWSVMKYTSLRPLRLFGPCMVHLLTGFYCPGCGGTRAVYALLQGQFVRSLVLHPIVPYTAVIGGWFMFSQTVERLSRGRLKIALHFRDVYIWIALGLILLNVLVKNLALILWGVDLLQ